MPTFDEFLETHKPHLFQKFKGQLSQEESGDALLLIVFLQPDASVTLAELNELHVFWRESCGKHDIMEKGSYDLTVRCTMGRVAVRSSWVYPDTQSPG
jgi:hypothetical protein